MDELPDCPEGGPPLCPLGEYEKRIAELGGLLKTAKCPDEHCDGKGTCAEQYWVNQETGDTDWRIWRCQWCAERASLLPGREV